MSALHLLWIVPLAGGAGMFVTAIFAGRRDIPPLCEDCPRVEQEAPIWEKYGIRKEETENDKQTEAISFDLPGV
jgi:hypothetical protein